MCLNVKAIFVIKTSYAVTLRSLDLLASLPAAISSQFWLRWEYVVWADFIP